MKNSSNPVRQQVRTYVYICVHMYLHMCMRLPFVLQFLFFSFLLTIHKGYIGPYVGKSLIYDIQRR
jgi:hypothetical protein